MSTKERFFAASSLAVAASLLFAAVVGISGCSDDDGSQQIDGSVDDGGWVDRIDIDGRLAVCGNGDVEDGEACDDGNNMSGDGCNASCTLEDSLDMVAVSLVEGDQNEPHAACNPEMTAAVWTDWSALDGEGAAVRLRLFHPDGRPMETFQGDDEEILVNTIGSDHQRQPRAALTPSGRIVVVWADGSGYDGDPNDIRMQIFEPDGNRLYFEILVNTTVSGDQQTPDIAVSSGGTILVVWADGSSAGPDTSGYGIRGRLFNDDGDPLVNSQTQDTADFQVNQVYPNVQRDPAASSDGGDGFVVIWADASGTLDPSGFGIAGTLLDSTGGFLSTDFLVNSTTAGNQIAPRVALQPSLGLAAIWTDYSLVEDMWESGIRARLLDTTGGFRVNHTGSDADFQVNTTYDSAQELPTLASDPDGNLLMVWQDMSATDGSSAQVRARAAAADGTPLAFFLSDGSDFQVNTTFQWAQHSPVVCNVGDWFVALWTDESKTVPDDQGDTVRYRLIPGF